jgi:CheY-like chemotaxis protein
MVSKYERILLVDDDVDDQKFFTEVLNEAAPAVNVVLADNGSYGLELMRSEYPDLPQLIFLDLNMPVMNGFEFLKIVKDNPVYSQIPVVIITTASGEHDRCYEMGACLYITKPTSYEAYHQVLTEILSRDVEEDCQELRTLFNKKVVS